MTSILRELLGYFLLNLEINNKHMIKKKIVTKPKLNNDVDTKLTNLGIISQNYTPVRLIKGSTVQDHSRLRFDGVVHVVSGVAELHRAVWNVGSYRDVRGTLEGS